MWPFKKKEIQVLTPEEELIEAVRTLNKALENNFQAGSKLRPYSRPEYDSRTKTRSGSWLLVNR